MRIGVLGGTFNPIHNAHLRLAEEAAEQFELDFVNLVLSSDPPHKNPCEITPAAIRWELLELACEDNDRLVPCDLEINRPGPSYTVDTLKEIRDGSDDDCEIRLLVGMDCVPEFKTWKSYRTILEISRMVVAKRPGSEGGKLPAEFEGRVLFLDMPMMDISSTRIRHLVRLGKSIRYLVPEAVRLRILDSGLYTSKNRSENLREACP